MSILTRVQSNPNISTDNATYVNELIERAKEFIVRECNLPRFPDLCQGYSKSNTSAGTDLSALDTEDLEVSVNGSGYYTISLTLANCTTGALTAAELQTQIRAEDVAGFEEVTVAYDSDDGTYTITSGRYGEDSAINVTFLEDYEDVCRSMKLSPEYGGTEYPGMADSDAAEDLAVMVTEAMYNRLSIEGMGFGMTSFGTQFNVGNLGLDPAALALLRSLRRPW